MLVAVLGASGVLGRQVLPRLLERGHRVQAVARQAEQVEALRRQGYDARLGDILDASSLERALAGCEAVLHLATVIPKPGGPQDWGPNDRVRREGTRNLLEAARRSAAGQASAPQAPAHPRYVQQSITFIYGDHGAQIVDESTPAASPAPNLQSAIDMEAQVRESGLDWCILRGGAFYGPGTGRDAAWRAAARAGKLRLPGDGAALLSLIHVVDMARAVVLALEAAPAGSTYNVVDDRPVSYQELYGYLAASAGGPGPLPGGPPAASLGCSNERLRAGLGWQPAFPSYRSGLAID